MMRLSRPWIAGSDPVAKPPRLLHQSRVRPHLHPCYLRADQAYLYWTRRYIQACGIQLPANVKEGAVERLFSRLATDEYVAASASARNEPAPGPNFLLF